jgi:hypothetical protein
MNVPVLARVNVRRESRTPVVKSRVSVDPSPRLMRLISWPSVERRIGRRNLPTSYRIAASDQRNA